MQKGTVKWFNKQKGYGFIETETGDDIFVHFTCLNMAGYKSLDAGQPVSFDISHSDKGPQAVHVNKLYMW